MNEYMKIAIEEARTGIENNEGGPFGCSIVKDGKVVGKGHNQVVLNNDPTCHGEMQAIRQACSELGTFDLSDCTLYTTGEPCHMCLSAIMWARIKKVYFGAYESKSGCAKSKFPVLSESGLNHTTEFEGGIEEDICANIIKSYFKSKRVRKSLD